MGRRRARELAFHFLYSIEIQKDDVELQRRVFVHDHQVAKQDIGYFDRLIDGVIAERAALDAMIAPNLHKWDIKRLPSIDLTLLRIGTYEIVHAADIPPSATINECVLLAKRYSNDEARAYINAVLGTIYRQQEEQAADSVSPAAET